jgi:hypothetical protein
MRELSSRFQPAGGESLSVMRTAVTVAKKTAASTAAPGLDMTIALKSRSVDCAVSSGGSGRSWICTFPRYLRRKTRNRSPTRRGTVITEGSEPMISISDRLNHLSANKSSAMISG